MAYHFTAMHFYHWPSVPLTFIVQSKLAVRQTEIVCTKYSTIQGVFFKVKLLKLFLPSTAIYRVCSLK